MPYKIVQTLEGKKYKIFTVPSAWVTHDNILQYPKQYISRYIKDENSTPSIDWEVIKCKVKRTNIASYAAGEQIVSEMLKHSDTEDDVANYKQARRPQHKKSLNLNSMAQEMMGNVALSNYNTDNPSSSLNEFNYNVDYMAETEANSTKTSQVSLDNITPLLAGDSVTFDVNKIFENQKSILDNQATILSQILQNQQQQQDTNTAMSAIIAQIQSQAKVQNGLIQKVSAFSVQLEDAVSQIISSSSQDLTTLNNSKGLIENIPISAKPVDSAQDLDALEKQLSDTNNRNRLKNTYSILCSGGKAVDCAYLLIDVMFTRKFISQCSWSGGSRGENLKIPLKGYKHVLSFFWQMIHFWDETYTLQDNEVFFKTILKNATKRKMAKLERASTSRQRSKSGNNLKRMKPCQENATITAENEACNAYETENKTNEEENAEKNKERNELQGENTEANNERNESELENTENNKEDFNENSSKDMGNSTECQFEEEEESLL